MSIRTVRFLAVVLVTVAGLAGGVVPSAAADPADFPITLFPSFTG